MSAPAEQNVSLDEYVRTADFDNECYEKALKHVNSFSDGGGIVEDEDLWFSDDGDSSAATVELSPYDVPKLEANLYYAGVGPKGRGPKLIYRTSEDVFEVPSGPEAYKRLMRVIAVPDTHEFGLNVTWDAIRDQVVVLLDQKKIKVTSVDFVRFTWLNKHADREIEDDENDDEDAEDEEDMNYDDTPRIQPVEYGDRHYTNPTIWIGVLPDTLTGSVAHDSSKDIRVFLDSLHVQNIDIAYRESLYQPLSGHGPALFPAVKDDGSLKDVIDNVSAALSLPIAGRKTTMQGTLGPYFRVKDKLYAITARHNVFVLKGDNEEYHYRDSGPKKEVMVMGAPAFKNYLASIQAVIGTHIDAVARLEKKVMTFRGRVQDGINVVESQKKLGKHETELANIRTKIEDLKNFFVNIKKKWSKPKDRVIGFVRWAPSIGVGVASHRYTRDLCVIELDKEKFRFMIGNVLNLGPEMSEPKLKSLIYQRDDVPSDFKYPDDGLLALRGILTADQVTNPTNLNLQDYRVRRVLKRGFATNTTVGTLTRFMSFVRQYFQTGTQESIEVAILSHEQDSGTFSKAGDSGALIVSTIGEFIALLTGGTSKGTDASDITYATPFERVWDLVQAEFPGANLDFDNLEEFLADVA
ncbi:unnamed protein product [Rhizoctonia solani]|uniref:Uncharacterized protein n=3 Tax=Rhizoctonia solani TaxID=456999 RepID=A0A8H2WYX5_9AGAM|nr:hypothetical protein RSOL_067160 [Rhizoctonia solani AG-3 Rhs1AP]KEP51865.1 hypothetical protein V565_054320 [Rhizoctonia solani 123E]CAE6389034.1 unnamed protein product [Rhizoctonia solani]CAE6407155.1 unnamed protein product [Rhizoctonia solani]